MNSNFEYNRNYIKINGYLPYIKYLNKDEYYELISLMMKKNSKFKKEFKTLIHQINNNDIF